MNPRLTALSVLAATILSAMTLAAVALAATETMRYRVPAGTVTKYASSSDTAMRVLEPVVVTASDGSTPPKELGETITKSFNETKIQTTGETTETVLEVQADGTHLVTSDASATTKSANAPETAPIRFVLQVAYKPDGTVEVREAKYMTDGLEKGVADALEKTAAGLKSSQQAAYDGLYGVAYEPNTPVTRTVENAALNALSGLGVTGTNVQSTINTTLTGRGTDGQYQFKHETSTPAFEVKLERQGLKIQYAFEGFTTTGTSSYLADGRAERTQVTSSMTMGIEMTVPGPDTITYQIKARLGIDSSTNVELAR
jgi:hypothetical protein